MLTGLPRGVGITLETFNDFVRVNIRAHGKKHFEGAVGLMGASPSGDLVARDGKTVKEDTNAFGQEWQVLANEEKLFHSRLCPGSFGLIKVKLLLVSLLMKLRITKRRCKQEIDKRGWSQRIYGRDQSSVSRRLDERF